MPRINSLPFAIFVTENKEKMNLRERFGTLCSRLEVMFNICIVVQRKSLKVGGIACSMVRTKACKFNIELQFLVQV